MMYYRKLGKTTLKFSEISLGGMSLPKDQSTCSGIIDYAIDHGINFIDTADLYEKGQNEICIGKALSNKRKDIYLGTKVGNKWNKDGKSWSWDPSKAHIIQAVESSLKRLKTDYIDLYQLHGGTIEDDMDETIEAFEFLVKQGKIRHYGISSIRPNVIKVFIEKSHIQSVMMQYSLLDRRPEEEMLSLLKNTGVSVLARGSMAKGLLINKEVTPYLDHKKNQLSALLSNFRSAFGENSQSFALAYVMNSLAIASAVIGISNLNQLKDAFAAYMLKVNEEDLEGLKNFFPQYNYQTHR